MSVSTSPYLDFAQPLVIGDILERGIMTVQVGALLGRHIRLNEVRNHLACRGRLDAKIFVKKEIPLIGPMLFK